MNRLTAILALLPLLLCGACRGQSVLSASPITEIPPRTSTFTVVPSPSATQTSTQAASTPTQFRPTVGPTLTPLPTLNTRDAHNIVMSLLTENAGCSIPCWWGIVPGETRWDVARQSLSQFASVWAGGSGNRLGLDGQVHFVESWSARYAVPGETSTGITNFGIRDGVVQSIHVGPIGTHLRYRLSQLLVQMGEPDTVRVWGDQIGDGTWPFSVLIYFSDEGVLAEFDLRPKETESYLFGCVTHFARPSLHLVDPAGPYHVADPELLGDSIDKALPLSDATGVDVAEFYQTYKSDEAEFCLRTPTVLWEK